MGLKTLFTKNAWNEQHAANIDLLKEKGLCDKSGVNRDFLRYADKNGVNIRNEPLTNEFIEEYLNKKDLMIEDNTLNQSDKIRLVICIILIFCFICCTIYATLKGHSSGPVNTFISSLHI